VGPWNFPLTLVLEPLAAALAAGNVVVIKPSEIAPTCSAMLAELVPRYFHASVVQIFEGAVAETTALLRLRWDHIFYTGNPHVGKIVMRAAAAHLTPVTLELGGKSPTVVDALGKVDIATAAKRIAYGKTFNNGQVCIAPDYILVHRSSQAKLVTALKAQFAKMFSETPRDSDSLARMINARHLDRVEGLLVDAHGGDVVLGGAEKIDKAVDPRFIPPTIVVEPSLEVRCSNIFFYT
jgi:aldehyde dehydrogenase (NAD+)